MAVTGQEGGNTFSQPGNQFGGTSIFAHFSCGTWGVVGSSKGLQWGLLPPWQPLQVECQQEQVGYLSKWRFGFQRTPPAGPHCPRQHHQKKKHIVPSSCIIPGQTLPKGMVNLA